MDAQVPAQGILKINEWGNSRIYKIECDCAASDCAHLIDIEATKTSVDVTIYVTVETNSWSWNGLMTRLRLTWDIWVKGYSKYQSSIILQEQVALNYAETLKSAINDLRKFRDDDKQ